MGALTTSMGLECHPGCPPFPLTSGAQIPRVLHPWLVHRGKEADMSLLQREGRPQEDVQQPVSFVWEWAMGRKSWPASLCIWVLPGPFLLPPPSTLAHMHCSIWFVIKGIWGWKSRTYSSDSHHSSGSLKSKLVAVAAHLLFASSVPGTGLGALPILAHFIL